MVGGDDPANVPESSKEAPHPQKPPADALSTSTYLTPESALASSPILKNDSSSPLPTLNDKLRASRVSSFRFSKDLEDIRWDGSSIREDDSMFPDEDEETHQDGDMSASEDEGNEGRPSKADLGAAAYSTLSKRAEFILANAKKKLNLLEGNLGRARHSLVSPTTMAEMRSASSLSSYATPGSSDEDEGRQSVKIPPRINFTPSRQARAAVAAANRANSGHNRMYSDTSVPSPGGLATKGSRSLDYVGNGDLTIRHPGRPTIGRSDSSASLVPVPEDTQMDSDKKNSIIALRELYGAASPPSKSTKELRDAAEELRNRIAFLQKRSQEDPAHYGFSPSNPNVEANEEAFLRQVNALKQSLEDQEQLLEELENADRSATEIESDPRGEWHQVLDYNDNRDSGSEFSDEEEDEEGDFFESDELPNVLGEGEGEDFPDETMTMAGAHEDREDAFDYEHFILHSAMGRYSSNIRSRSPSPSSVGSSATAQGQDTQETVQHEREQVERNVEWDRFQQPNESAASLATTQTFETAAERVDSASDSASITSDQPPEELLHSDNPWPMPPASSHSSQSMNGNIPRSIVGEGDGEKDEPSTPTASNFRAPVGEDKGIQHESARRPVSTIYHALVAREGEREARRLEEGDSALLRSTIESLRKVCVDLNGDEKRISRDMKGLRERLAVAKRILDGEL